jgi:hypothetical protein
MGDDHLTVHEPMRDGTPDRQSPRWQYRIVWRYGPLLLIILGVGLFAIGLSGLCVTAVSTAALPVGLILVISGAVLPRIEGKFSAGPHGITAPLLAVHELEKYTVTGPALAPVPDLVTGSGVVALPKPTIDGNGGASGSDDGGASNAQGGGNGGRLPAPITLGDVWDAIKAKLDAPGGFRAVASGMGRTYLLAPDGRTLSLAKPGDHDWRPVSNDLLGLLAEWGVKPVASGRYRIPAPQHPGPGVMWQLNPDELHIDGQDAARGA